jgi:hypothetical protein
MEPEVEFTQKRGSAWKWVALLVLVALLAGAAFVGGQLLSREGSLQTSVGTGPGMVTIGGEGGGAARVEVALQVTPASEIPAGRPDEVGLFVSREDNSIFIGTGQVMIGISSEPGSEPSAEYDGPVVEVVVGAETLVYKDVSEMPAGPPEGDVVIQQVVAPGTVEEIGEMSSVMVWGRKVGDRLIADILVYTEARFINLGPAGP